MNWKCAVAVTAIAAQSVAAPFAWAPSAPEQASQATLTGFVVPSEVRAEEPFTFAATGVEEGEVLSIQTETGEVVAKKKPDNVGRVALTAGLAAGLYFLTREGGKSGQPKPKCPIDVKPQPEGGTPVTDTLEITRPSNYYSLSNGVKLSGNGISPNAADMVLKAGNTEVPVLASTAREMQTGPISNLKPGYYDLDVQNSKTGQSQNLGKAGIYDLKSRLTRTRVANSEVTELELTMEPKNIWAKVLARILSGPVHFPGGKKETEIEVKEGKGKAPILADPAGTGKFTVGWEVLSLFDGPQQEPKKGKCSSTEHAKAPGGWTKKSKTVNGKKVYIAERAWTCEVKSKCNKEEGHSGTHDYAASMKCGDKTHHSTETHEFSTQKERDDYIKDHP